MKTMTIDSFAGRSHVLRDYGKSNVGSVDRVIRVTLGALLLADGLHGTGPLGMDTVLMLLSIPLIVSAIIAWDPIYAFFQVRTATLPMKEVPYRKQRSLNANGGINVGTVDRIGRLALAGGLLATPFLWSGPIGVMAIATTAIGIMVMMTAVTGWDPFYQLARVRTVTLPIGTLPQPDTQDNINHLNLFDQVEGDGVDVYQKAA